MIILNKVRWKNFLSTGNFWTEIELDKSKKTLIIGDNGAGKSTLIDALCFCFYNKAFRNINKPLLVNTITQKDCIVEIEMKIGNNEYIVKRGIKPNIFEIHKNGKLLNQDSDQTDYQALLEKHLLKMNYKSFTQIVILGSANFMPFMKMPTYVRREIIEDLLDLRVFSLMNTLLKEKINKNKADLQDVDHKIDIVDNKIKINEKRIQELKENNDELIDIKNKKIDEYQQDIDKLQDDILHYESQVEELLQEYQKAEKTTKKHKEIQDIRDKISKKITKLYRDIEFYKNNERCSSCGQEISEDFKNNKISLFENEQASLTEAANKLEKEIDKISEKLSYFDIVNENIKDLNVTISQNNVKISSYQRYIKDLSKEIAILNKRKNEILDDNSQKDFEEELKNYRSKKEKYLEDREILNISSVLLKDGGIKAQVVKQYIPVMNKVINQYLQEMDFFIQFELNENFEETIRSRFRDEFSYECLFSDSRITTEDGLKTISWIVKNKYRGKVLSINNNGDFVWNNIEDAWSNKNFNKKWVRIKVDGDTRGTKSQVICTDDHKLLTVRDPFNICLEWSMAKDSLDLYSVRKPSYRDAPIFNDEQVSIMIGIMLGDGSINKEGQFITSHKHAHREYVELTQKIFGGTIDDRYYKNTFGEGMMSSLIVRVNAQTKLLYDMMYYDDEGNKCKKTLKNVINSIDEKSLAFWYMDDGSTTFTGKYRACGELCTDGFSVEDCELAKKVFYEKWSIICEVVMTGKDRQYPRLIFGVDASEKLFSLIAPYVTNCMQYKLPEKYRNLNDYQFNCKKKDYALSKITMVKYLDHKKYSSRLYDMKIENNCNFIANDTVVHNSFSEGEKVRINLAILFSWRQIAKMRNSASCNLLIFDEIFDGSLDGFGIDEFMKILDKVSPDTNTFVISHKKDQMIDKFDHVIKFHKEKNFSRRI